MSKLLGNKQQLIHVASEVVVLLGLTFYFNSQNKKLTGHIEDLAQRIEEQEDLIQNHENIIKQLVKKVNTLDQTQQRILQQIQKTPIIESKPQRSPPHSSLKSVNLPRQSVVRTGHRKSAKLHTQPPLDPPSQPTSQHKVYFQEHNKPILKSVDMEDVIQKTDDDQESHVEQTQLDPQQQVKFQKHKKSTHKSVDTEIVMQQAADHVDRIEQQPCEEYNVDDYVDNERYDDDDLDADLAEELADLEEHDDDLKKE